MLSSKALKLKKALEAETGKMVSFRSRAKFNSGQIKHNKTWRANKRTKHNTTNTTNKDGTP